MTAPTRAFAFYGRVSTDDAQDPSLSIPRQLTACERALEPGGGEIVTCFWDIESGRKALAERGHGADGSAVKVPRDGGLRDLLHAATNGRSFDAVIVESIDRLSRMTADATSIERQLEDHDVGLFAADEPISTGATAVLTRRVKQGVAEWYVRDLVERSRRGMEESARQGWHMGGPVAYGYQLEEHPHPNPQKAREGKKKHRLLPDPLRAPIVQMIFEDYCLHGLGLGELCDKLNSNLERYPPPRRNRKDDMPLPPTWSRSQLWSLLRNPKYTGYNVWGRHDKRRGRPFMRPREQWVWSPTPVHEPIVARELFERVEDRAHTNEHRAKAPLPKAYRQRNGKRNGRLYALRGRVRCGLCGRRMEGSHQKGNNWYRCQFVSRRGVAGADAAGHPRVLGIKEDIILEHTLDFLARRIFGPERLALLRHELAHAVATAWTQHDTDLERLRRELQETERSLHRQALRLEEHDDPHHPVIALAKQRITELSARRDAATQAIADLEATRPLGARPEEIKTMLAAVPDLRSELERYQPAELAELLDAFDVTATYDKPNQRLELAATVTPELVTTLETKRPPEGRSRNCVIAGAGFEPATFGL